MLKKLLSLFLLLFLINCGGGGGGATEPSAPIPDANFSGTPVSGVKPLTVNFISSSTETTTNIWDFENDGIDDATGDSYAVTYNQTGTYSVKLTATGPGGSDVMIKPNYITVVDASPVANFEIDSASGPAPFTVNFTSTSTGANTFSWDFDDDGNVDSTSSSPTYTYNNVGTFSVSLTVTGPGGTNSITKNNLITVTDPVPTASYTASQVTGTNPLRVLFTNTSSYYTSATWDFGDGNTSTESGSTVVHTYTSSGSFDVNLQVAGPGGSDSDNSVTINVNDIQIPAIVLDPKYIETTSGSSIPIDVKVLGVSGMAAAQVTLFYDNSVMTYDSVTAGDFLKGDSDPLLVVTSNPGDNRLIIYTSSLSSDLPSNDGDGIIATVNFTLNGTTDTNVNFGSDISGNIMLDVDGADITVNDVVGSSILINE